jgi:Helicase associated domain
MDRLPSSLPQGNSDDCGSENDVTAARTNASGSSCSSRQTLVHPLMNMAMMMSVDPNDDEPDDANKNDDGNDQAEEVRRSYSHEEEPSAKRHRPTTAASASRVAAPATAAAPALGTVASPQPSTAAAHDADNNEANNNKQPVHQEQWNEMLERLAAYKAWQGNCLVPKRYAEDPRLGTWVETQRVQVSVSSSTFYCDYLFLYPLIAPSLRDSPVLSYFTCHDLPCFFTLVQTSCSNL